MFTCFRRTWLSSVSIQMIFKIIIKSLLIHKRKLQYRFLGGNTTYHLVCAICIVSVTYCHCVMYARLRHPARKIKLSASSIISWLHHPGLLHPVVSLDKIRSALRPPSRKDPPWVAKVGSLVWRKDNCNPLGGSPTRSRPYFCLCSWSKF